MFKGGIAVKRFPAVLLRPLFITQHGDAFLGQAPGQVTKRSVGTNGFIPIIRTGTVHQHHGWKWSVAIGPGNGAGQIEIAGAHNGVFFLNGTHRWRGFHHFRPGQQGAHFARAIDADGDVYRTILEFRRVNEHFIFPGGLTHRFIQIFLERAQLGKAGAQAHLQSGFW